MTREFKQETGLPFSFLFALYEGGSGDPAVKEDAEAYAEYIGDPRFPVFADGEGRFERTTPLDPSSHPQICALTDELVILGCYNGHGTYEDALDDIREHAGL